VILGQNQNDPLNEESGKANLREKIRTDLYLFIICLIVEIELVKP